MELRVDFLGSKEEMSGLLNVTRWAAETQFISPESNQ